MMSPAFPAVLVALGLVTGDLAERFSSTRRGSLLRRWLARSIWEGALLAPAGALIGMIVSRSAHSPDLQPQTGPLLVGAFLVPYVAVRVAKQRRRRLKARDREGTLPFQYWYGLLRTNPAAARDFLAAYVREVDTAVDEVAQITQLERACVQLAEAHSSDPLLPGALSSLRARIDQLTQRRRSTPLHGGGSA